MIAVAQPYERTSASTRPADAGLSINEDESENEKRWKDSYSPGFRNSGGSSSRRGREARKDREVSTLIQ